MMRCTGLPVFARSSTRTILRWALLAMAIVSVAVAGPVGEEVVHGTAQFAREGNLTTITAGDKAIINYSSFDVARSETVRFIQPGELARVLNRIQGATPTQIDGTLRANGIVYFVNPAGVRFGPSSVVDVGQLVAAAGKLSNADFLGGVDRFTDLAGEVVNWGSISGGAVRLVGANVANYGSIVAEGGLVAMVAGNEVTLTRIGSQMMVKVSGGGGERPGVENAGEINAARGSATLGAGDLFSLAVRNVGTVKARSVTVQGRAAEGSGRLEAEELTVNATAGPDAMALRASGDGIEIGLNGATLSASAPGQLTINAGGGDDSLTVDTSAGNPIPAGGLLYNGQDNTTPTGDSLVLTGSAASVGYLFTGPTSGAITLDGATLTYTGLEPIVDVVVTGTFTINATAGPDAIAITDGPGSGGFTTSLVTIGAFETIEFANKTTVIINGDAGPDSFTLSNPNPADGMTTLQLNGSPAGDQFNVTAIGGGVALDIQGGAGGDTATVTSAGTVGTPLTSGTFNVETLNLAGPIYAATVTGSPGAVDVQNNTALIQNAIDVAAAGATINVAAGAYTEDLQIDKGLTLDGGGAASLNSQHTISASNVTMTGWTFNGGGNETIITIDPSGGAIDNTTISSNTFNLASGDVGIWVGGPAPANAITNTTISGNTFNGPVNMVSNPLRIGGWFGSTLDVAVTGLTFSGNTVDRGSIPVFLHDQNLATLTFQGNTFTNTDGVLYIWDNAAATPSGVLSGLDFSGNTVDATNSYGVGIDLFDTYTDANFGAGNAISGNDFVGIPGAYGFGAVSILSTGLTTYMLDAEDNWWGTTSGPTHPSNVYNVGSQGSPVSDNVDYFTWLDGPFATGSPFAPIANLTQGTGHASFQDAIDNAAEYDWIEAADGVFTEDFVIDVGGLAIYSSNGAASTTIQGITGVCIDITTNTDVWPEMTLGVPGQGFTVLGGAATTSLLRLTGTEEGVELVYNVFDTTGNASTAIEIAPATDASFEQHHDIRRNTFLAEEGDGSVTATTDADLLGVSIEDNHFIGPNAGGGAFPASGHAIELHGGVDHEVDGNVIDGYATGILVGTGHTTEVEDLSIALNTITNCGIGVRFVQDPATLGVPLDATVVGNVFDNNDIGIHVGNGPGLLGSEIEVFVNSFTNHATWAIQSTNDAILDCSLNWWGTNDPAQVPNQFTSTANGGNGIDYTPWPDSGTNLIQAFLGDYSADDDENGLIPDISGTGTQVALGDDAVSGPIDLGFTFTFYDTDYTQVYISSNGFLTFTGGQPSGTTAAPVPDAAAPDHLIAGWWGNLDPTQGAGAVYYQSNRFGARPGRRDFVVQFRDVEHSPSGNPVTFEIELNETSNNILVHYQTVATDGSLHTVGVENQNGTAGTQYFHGTTALPTDVDEVWFEPNPGTGFFPDMRVLHVDDNSPQVQPMGRIEEAHVWHLIGMEIVGPPYTIHVHEGTYNSGLGVRLPLTLNLPDGAVQMDGPVELGDHLTVTGNQDLTFNDTILGAADGVADLLMDLGAGNVTFTDAIGAPGAGLRDFTCTTTGPIVYQASGGNPTGVVTVDVVRDLLMDGPVTLDDHVTVTGGQSATFTNTIGGATDGTADLIMDLNGSACTFTDAVGQPGARLRDFTCGTTGSIAFLPSAGNVTNTVNVAVARDVVLGNDRVAPPDRATIWHQGGTLDVAAGQHITIGAHHAVSVPYALGVSTLNLTCGGILTTPDLNAGSLNLTATTLRVRQRGTVDTLRADNTFETSFATELVGLDTFTAFGAWETTGNGLPPVLAMLNGPPAFAPNGFNPGVLRPQGGPAEFLGTGPNTDERLDLIADGAARDLSSAFASAIPRLEDVEVVPDEVGLSAAVRELLEQIGIFARDPHAFERGTGTFDDLITKPPSQWTSADHQVAVTRLNPDLTRRAVALYREIFWVGDEYRAKAIKATLQKCLDHCKKKHEGQEFDAAKFRKCMETDAVCKDSLAIVNKLRELFATVGALGLNRVEAQISERIIVRDIIPRGLRGRDLIATVKGGAS
ncbi:filamentous hemagglutinin N-terminal domain-containing protein [Planctomycetota bacterium]